jgi:putative ABC transport system ATP-binding protein
MSYNNPPIPGEGSQPLKPALRKKRLQADKVQIPIEDMETHKIPIIDGSDGFDTLAGHVKPDASAPSAELAQTADDIAQQPTQAQTAVATLTQEPEPKKDVPVISVHNLTKTYQIGKETRVQALAGVSLDVYPGEFVVVLGPSGSGKSTFMNLVGCLDRPSAGEYWLAGKLVSKLSTDDLADVRNRLIGFVFQGFNLLSRATALKNVALPMVYAGLSQAERENRALVGLGKRVNHKPPELSGGQQQRVAVARALVNGPSLLLADEPTGNLDSRTSVEIMAVLQALNDQGLTIILVTHDLKVADYARRQVSFIDGQIVKDEMVKNRRIAQAEWVDLNKKMSEQQGNAHQTQVKEEPV